MEKIVRRPRNTVQQEPLVKEYFFNQDRPLPYVVEANQQDLNLELWLKQNAENIEEKLLRYGAVLFRNFAVSNIQEFEEVTRSFGKQLLNYDFASTPRTAIKGKIYTSTEYPPDQEIIMHNEVAYSKKWPGKLWFYCQTPPEAGGETPLVDSRKMYDRVPPDIRKKFEDNKLIYVRNYHENLDLDWKKVFQTENRAEVEQYCNENGIEYNWVEDGHLQTKEKCQAIVEHPETKEKAWFNQAHLFHISNLSEEVKKTLLTLLNEEMVPRNVYLGNGEAIDSNDLDQIRQLYQQEKSVFPWKKSDVLLVDNVLVAHGRHPYEGDRKIIVAMTD